MTYWKLFSFPHEKCLWDLISICLFCYDFLRRLLLYLDRGLPGKDNVQSEPTASLLCPDYALRAGRFGDRMPVGASLSAPVQTGPETIQSAVQWIWVIPLGKAAGAWCWPPTPSKAEVKKRVELYFYSHSGPYWPVLGWTLPLRLPVQEAASSETFVATCHSIWCLNPDDLHSVKT